ncbi:MAG: hypothetical protein PVH18_10520, partial [Chloroflexota bacterium]
MRKTVTWFIITVILLLLACNLPVQNSMPAPTEELTGAPETASPTRELPTATAIVAATETAQDSIGDEPVVKDLTERPQIWFGPLDPWSWDQYFPGQGPFQFYDLFTEEAEWQQASEAVHVIRLYPVWLESYATPTQIETVLNDIQR